MGKINWDVVKAVGGQLLTAGGAVSTALLAFGYSQQQVDGILAAAGAVLSLICMIGPSLIVAFQQTDAGKAKTIQRLDPTGRQAVLQKLPPETVVQAAKDRPEVTAVVVNPAATGPVAWMATDPTESKVRVGT